MVKKNTRTFNYLNSPDDKKNIRKYPHGIPGKNVNKIFIKYIHMDIANT